MHRWPKTDASRRCFVVKIGPIRDNAFSKREKWQCRGLPSGHGHLGNHRLIHAFSGFGSFRGFRPCHRTNGFLHTATTVFLSAADTGLPPVFPR